MTTPPKVGRLRPKGLLRTPWNRYVNEFNAMHGEKRDPGRSPCSSRAVSPANPRATTYLARAIRNTVTDRHALATHPRVATLCFT
jgi:hypothetical protein